MVLGAGAVVATAGAALPAIAAAAGTAGTVAGAGAAVGTAAGAVAGAATGAVVGGTLGAATVAGGTVVATATAAGSAATVAGTAITTAGVIAGPVGWLVLGSSLDEGKTESGITYDCWKPVLHDTSSEPSQGKLLREVMEDPRIKQVIIEEQLSQLPLVSLVNIWDEQFDIQYMILPSNNQMAAHAIQIQ